MLGTSRVDHYSLVEAAHKKWLEDENDPDDDNYELPILKYDVNQEALVEQIKGTLVEEEEELITPSQSTSKEGRNENNTNKECCGSNNHVPIKSRQQEECGSPSYVRYRRHTSK